LQSGRCTYAQHCARMFTRMTEQCGSDAL